VSGVCAAGLAAARQAFETALPQDLLERLERQSIASGEASRGFINGQTNLSLLMSDMKLIARWPERLRLLRQHVFPPPAYMFRTYGTSSRPLLPALYTKRLFTGAWRWIAQSYRSSSERSSDSNRPPKRDLQSI